MTMGRTMTVLALCLGVVMVCGEITQAAMPRVALDTKVGIGGKNGRLVLKGARLECPATRVTVMRGGDDDVLDIRDAGASQPLFRRTNYRGLVLTGRCRLLLKKPRL